MRKCARIRPRKSQGSVVLPAEKGDEHAVADLAALWGCTIIRDSDGTQLSEELLKAGFTIYSTICLVRADQQWPRDRRDTLPQKFLMSEPVTAVSETVTIDPMENYFTQKYALDTRHDPHAWWQVHDRTTGREVSTSHWKFDQSTGKVTITGATRFHVYTVNFLVYQVWDSTSMYNHITNDWDRLGTQRIMSTDPYHADAYSHLMEFFDRWLADHPRTDVVRLTTLAFHFVLDSDGNGVDKYRDWMGYMDTVSVAALQDFERENGYRLTSEDFVDQGYYNATYRVPSPKYLDWMRFVHRFVLRFGRDLVTRVHAAGKKAAIFQGDHWVGVEPYSPAYPEMEIDINVGAVEDGVALRRLADSPWDEVKEIRLYPYFFPDVMKEGGGYMAESVGNWMKIRRALLRSPVDRIGWGGYLSLASRFPEFTSHLADICDEFRALKNLSGRDTGKGRPWSAPVKVAVLSAWGGLRSWLNNFGRDQKFFLKRPDVVAVAGSNLLESLSGVPVEVRFLSLSEVEEQGISSDVTVLINDGEDGSAWSGGRWWAHEAVVRGVREFVHRGGGFIGCVGPSAHDHGGRHFQLGDVMGVDRETGNTVMTQPVKFSVADTHFITNDDVAAWDPGTERTYVFPVSRTARILRANGLHVLFATHQYGAGRSVFIAGLPYSRANARLLHRALFWAAGRESDLQRWFSTSIHTDCAAFPDRKTFAVANTHCKTVNTTVYDGDGEPFDLKLKPHEIKWFRTR